MVAIPKLQSVLQPSQIESQRPTVVAQPAVATMADPAAARALLANPTAGGVEGAFVFKVAGGTSASEAEREYRGWIDTFNRHWRSEVARPIHARFGSREIDARIEALRRRVGPEWAKPTGVGKITTADLQAWMPRLNAVQTPEECLALLGQLDALVDQRLRNATPWPQATT